MKIKLTLFALSALVATSVTSNAALFAITNVANGPGDTLYATNSNTLMTSGLVTLGYFGAGVTQSQIDTISELHAILQTSGSFTTITSSIPGLGTSQVGDGYADGTATPVNLGNITLGNPLLGRTIYSIVVSAPSLELFASGVLNQSNQVALVNMGLIKDDVPDVQQYFSNPVTPATVVIGSYDTFTISDGSGLGDGSYNTLKMAVVPEPSAALLGAVGALGLLRRRRI